MDKSYSYEYVLVGDKLSILKVLEWVDQVQKNLGFVHYLQLSAFGYLRILEPIVVHEVELEGHFGPRTNEHQNPEDGDLQMPSSHQRHGHRAVPLTE